MAAHGAAMVVRGGQFRNCPTPSKPVNETCPGTSNPSRFKAWQTWAARLQAGAASIDITPTTLPAIVNGGFLERKVSTISDQLHTRSIVLSEGDETISITLIDSCMVPRDLCDEAKALEAKRAAEEAIRTRTGDMEIAEAQAVLAESVAQLAAIKKLRKVR